MAIFPSLARFAGTAPVAPRDRGRDQSARCELCSAPIGGGHRHVVELERRALRCACAACSVLFRDAGAGAGRFRTVPDRVLVDPTSAPDDAAWAALGVPVRLAFILFSSAADRAVAFYPSPAGPIEAPVAAEAWRALVAASALARSLEPDVEALLVRRERSGAPACFVAPVDACYELVGLVRRHWRGSAGGDEAWRPIDDFFARLRARGAPLAKGAAP